MDTNVGFSTGAIAAGDVETGIATNSNAGATIIELSCLAESELPQVEAINPTDLLNNGLTRVSVHGPAKERALPEDELIERLLALPGTPDVVMHPDIFEDITRWAQLGTRLLVENNDSRKRYGNTTTDLDAVFEHLPEANMCLDISHALDVGGPQHATELARRYSARITQLHIGCGCGRHVPDRFEPELLAAAHTVFDIIGTQLPVILERTITNADPHVIEDQLTAVRTIT